MAVYPQIPTTTSKRRDMLRKYLKQFQKKYYCPALKSYVKVTANSIRETAYWAGVSVLSTKLAIRLPYIISNAKMYQDNIEPKNNHQKTRFHFIKIANLTCGIKGLGTAILTIGYRSDGENIEYCVTNFRAKSR